MAIKTDKHLTEFFKHLDFLINAPLGYRRTASFRGFAIVFTPTYIFVISQREYYVFVELEDVKEHLKEQLE